MNSLFYFENILEKEVFRGALVCVVEGDVFDVTVDVRKNN